MWQHDQSILTLVVLKIENRKIKQNENKNEKKNREKLSLLFVNLTSVVQVKIDYQTKK